MKKLLSILIVLIFAYGMAYADGFTNDNLQGDYAVDSITGANNGCSIGLLTFDGNGNFTGKSIMNVPGLFLPKRMRLEVTSTGTYDVNPDGTAVGTMIFTTPDGISVTVHLDAIAKKVEVVNGMVLATEIVGFFDEPGTFILEGKPGLLTTFNATRLPD